MVDGRVGDLREPLPQVRGERARATRERGQGSVVAHRVDGVAAGLRDRAQHHAELFPRVAEERVTRREALDAGRRAGLAGFAPLDAGVDPRRIGSSRRQVALQLAVEEQTAFGVDRQLLPGAEPCPSHACPLGQRDRACLGGHGDEVAGHGDPQRPEAVAVERRRTGDAVGEDEPGRTVPRLDEHRVVAVHGADVVVDARVVLPGGRHEHRGRLAHVAPGVHEQLERVVEQRRVRAVAVERGRQPGVDAAGQLAGLHPGDVAVDRVDLAVVAEQAERLRTLPARLGVGREALVEDRPGDGERRVAQVGIERRQLRRRAERLVGHRAKRERGDVDAVDRLGAAAGAIGAQLGVGLVARREQQLRDARHARDSRRAERRDLERHVAPAGGLETLRATGFLDDVPQPRLAQEAHRQAGAARPGERGRERQEHAGAVAGDAVGSPRAAVRHGGETRERTIEQLARRPAADVGDEADAAGVAFEGAIVDQGVRAQGSPAFRGPGTVGRASRRCVCR